LKGFAALKFILTNWTNLLDRLASFPRENGSVALRDTAEYLTRVLRSAGLDVEQVPFTAHPYETRLLGVFILLACLAFFFLLRRKRFFFASLLAGFIPVVAILQVEFNVPLVGRVGAEREYNVVARIPGEHSKQRLILAAHFDTKTDLFDHLVRTPIQVLGLPLCGLMLLAVATGAIRRAGLGLARFRSGVAWAAALYGPLFFLAYSAGAFLPARSSGALDDGAACAVLVEVASELAKGTPLQQTEIRVVLFSGEELGAEGSAQYVALRSADLHSLPTYVLNLDPVGASRRLAVVGTEGRLVRSYRPDARIRSALARAMQEISGKNLELTARGGLTDAVSFESKGIPSATLISEVPPFVLPRGMHTSNDTRSRIDLASLDLTVRVLLKLVGQVDARGWTD
jgi:hypothetical protein